MKTIFTVARRRKEIYIALCALNGDAFFFRSTVEQLLFHPRRIIREEERELELIPRKSATIPHTHCHAKFLFVTASNEDRTKTWLVLKPSLREIASSRPSQGIPSIRPRIRQGDASGSTQRRQSEETDRSSETVEPPGCYRRVQRAGRGSIVMMFMIALSRAVKGPELSRA